MNIIKLTKEYEEKYSAFLLQNKQTLVYASLAYRNFFQRVCPNSKDHYLLLLEDNVIVAALPTFIYDGDKNGKIINSLPFYGSHGAIIVRSSGLKADSYKHALLRAFLELAEKEEVKAATLISNPLLNDSDFYEKNFPYTHKDERIGQLKRLTYQGSEEKTSNVLLETYHQKTRNLVRKGRGQFDVMQDDSFDALKWLYDTHTENMQSIGAGAKPWSIFEALSAALEYGEQYRVYIADYKGEKAGGLLLLYFNQCVEYFVPVIKKEFRSRQALSAIIHECMIDAVERGYQWWNWGGTWLSQLGVYHFKSRWGTTDFPYYYFTKIYDRNLLNVDKSSILKNFPNYYVYPFG